MKAVKKMLIMCVIFCASFAIASPPCGSNAYGKSPCLFVPAKPGQTPACASPGSTFCEKVNTYPDHVIKTLLKSFQSKDILTDEAKVDFNEKKQSSYDVHDSIGPPGFNYGPFDHPGDYYGQGMDSNHHYPNIYNYNGHRPSGSHNNYRPSSGGKGGGGGYHYPTPGPSSSSFFQSKPSHYDYDSYHRTTRKRRFNKPEANQMIIREEFLRSISPRSKRQISENREQLCEIRTNYINPQAALNSRGNWMYIVNGVEMATQLVRTETCASTECSNLCQLPNGYDSRCEQKYVQKRLVALDARGDRLYSDTFWFPSCCVCTLSNN